ncbi:MAG: beta-N-acetylhexosaminidase [Limnochordia bacterium]|jgi:hexosaminidase
MAQEHRLHFQGDVQDCMEGLQLLAPDFRYQLSADGLTVTVEQQPGCPVTVEKKGNQATIRYSEKIHFFRALGLLLEQLAVGSGDFSLSEEPQFTMNGVMYDVSQGNAVPRVETVKNILRRMAIMGLNMLMMYTEDSYVVPEEPYFGYMRPKFTHDDLRECDEYAAILGIEMIPCMQTLAHLPDVLKWPVYADIKEDDTTLLVGSDRTYEFIENMIKAAAAPFRTKRIHIGMDEAWRLGMGAYFRRHGLRNKFDIMTEHLTRVLEIVEKHGLQPMMWSDMFFRAASKSGGYYDLAVEFTPEMLASMPKGVELVYWDYYHHDEKFYREFIKRHREFGTEPIFAGGIWNWISYTVNWSKTFVTTNAALNACKHEGVKEVFATVWGDNGTECSIYTTLLGLQLFAEHGYARELDMERLKRRFEFCTGARYDDFINLKYLDEIPGTESDNLNTANPSKYLMWQDILAGLFDKNIEGHPVAAHYAKLANTLSLAVKRNGAYNSLFEFLHQVAEVLALKSEMGLKVTEAYRAGDRQRLEELASDELPALAKQMKKLHECHRRVWLDTYKAFGWDIMDMRYASIEARINSAVDQIERYLGGDLPEIEELEAERLYYNGKPGVVRYTNYYPRIVSGSPIAARG